MVEDFSIVSPQPEPRTLLITIYSEPSVSLILTAQLVIAGFLW